MNNVVIKDNNGVNVKAYKGAGMYITANGSVLMDGGAILNNYSTFDDESNSGGGGVHVAAGGKFVMNGGSISDNGVAAQETSIAAKEYYVITFAQGSVDAEVEGYVADIMVNKAETSTTIPVNQYVAVSATKTFVFKGWKISGTNTIIADKGEFTYNASMASNNVITLIAIWEEVTSVTAE